MAYTRRDWQRAMKQFREYGGGLREIKESEIRGARANVGVGTDTRRTTATRVALGTAILPGVGTIVGAMAKKTEGRLFVAVTLKDGRTKVSDAINAKTESDVRQFVAWFNEFAA